MARYFTIKYYPRIRRGGVRSGKEPHEQEKGVDIAMAVQIMNTVWKAKAGKEKFRIVILSADSDFKPVVQDLLSKKIPVEVWTWTGTAKSSCISGNYEEFMNQKKNGTTILRSLEVYRYQVGFAEGIKHEWSVIFDPSLHKDGKLDEHTDKHYRKLSHYEIAHKLIEEARFNTYDFVTHWSKEKCVISFLTEAFRMKFEDWLKDSNDRLAQFLKTIPYRTNNFTQARAEANQDRIMKDQLEAARMLDKELESGSDSGSDSDSETPDSDDAAGIDDFDDQRQSPL